jgi:hypothetical protein
VTGDDLIIAAPWLVFAAGLAVIGWRLAVCRGRRRRSSPRKPSAPAPARIEPPPGPPGPPARNRPAGRGTPLGRADRPVAQNGRRRDGNGMETLGGACRPTSGGGAAGAAIERRVLAMDDKRRLGGPGA